MFVLERKTVPAQLMLLILQFEPVNPIAFSKSSRRYLTEEIRNLELVIRFALKKASFFKQFPKLGHQVLSFFKPISFNTDISLDSELALVKERLDVQDWMIKLFSGYLVQQFLKCTMLIEARMSMSDNFLLPLDHFLFVESNKSSDWSSYHAPDGDCSDNWYFYNYWLPNVIKAIDKNKLVKLLDNPQSIFGLFKFYLTRALALNSTFVQFRNTKLVLLDPSLRTKRQRAYLQSLLVSTGPELRRSLSSLIGPRLAIIFLIGPKLVLVFLMGAFDEGIVTLSRNCQNQRTYDW